VNQSSSETATLPVGYVNIGSFKPSASGESLAVWRKTAAGGETSATVSFSGSALFSRTTIALVYRGVDQTNPIDQIGGASTGLLKTSVTVPSLTTTAEGDELVLAEDALSDVPGTTLTPPAGMATKATTATLLVSAAAADQSLGAAGPTGVRTVTTNLPATLEAVAVALRRAPSADFLLHDQRGSTRLLTDSHGAVRATYSYSPYGTVTSHTGPDSTSLRYDGQYQDDESGLYYLDHRYYDPYIAQLITVDPLTFVTNQPYAYVADDPLNLSDPIGWLPPLPSDYVTPSELIREEASGNLAPCTFAHLLSEVVTREQEVEAFATLNENLNEADQQAANLSFLGHIGQIFAGVGCVASSLTPIPGTDSVWDEASGGLTALGAGYATASWGASAGLIGVGVTATGVGEIAAGAFLVSLAGYEIAERCF
jgi:RHS repeat-associated protein